MNLCLRILMVFGLIHFMPVLAQADSLGLRHWRIQDSGVVQASIPELSRVDFDDKDWTPASVPGTVLGALVETGRYGDVFHSDKLRQLPGSGPVWESDDFKDLEIPADSPFSRPWFYRTTFTIPTSQQQKNFELDFAGLTYRADIWLNGKQIANSQDVAGTYRHFHFDVNSELNTSTKNVLLVRVYAPFARDLTATWVDWNPTPQDKNMGLWREVTLSSRDAVKLSDPNVLTKLGPKPSSVAVDLSIDAENKSGTPLNGVLAVEISGRHATQKIRLNVGEKRRVHFSSAQFSSLHFSDHDLWWPYRMGESKLHDVEWEFTGPSGQVDRHVHKVGLREITSELLTPRARLFRINGKPIQIRGGGWAPDMFLRFSKERLEKEFRFAKDLGLNTIRLEGNFETTTLYDLADQEGLLLMPGWTCCNAWQYTDRWTNESLPIAVASLTDQVREMRTHPSVFVFLYGSDEAPPPTVEAAYLNVFKTEAWPNPVVASATTSDTIAGKSGFKMNGPYDYVPPLYWYVDQQYGGAWGFNTETSPGVSIPPIETLKEMLEPKDLWPINANWIFHAGRSNFRQIDIFANALTKRYGSPTSLEDFAYKSNLMAYDGHRAMFEAYGKNKYQDATGIIQWMLNNSWPSLIWHLYDHELRTGGAYFGVKKANEPLHVQYSYDDDSIVVVNSTYERHESLHVEADVYDSHMKLLEHRRARLNVAADASKVVLQLRTKRPSTELYFVRLQLRDQSGERLSENFYWLSRTKEVFDWAKTNFAFTPLLQEADLTGLQALPRTKVKTSMTIADDGHSGTVTLENVGTSLAFFCEVQLVEQKNTLKDVKPILWSDNFLTLLPGETRKVSFTSHDSKVSENEITARARGLNVDN